MRFLNKLLMFLPDKQFLQLKYLYVFKKPLNLRHPLTFNEKLQWLKLYNRNEEYSCLVDKCEVKKYVASKIGQEHIIPTLGIYDSFSDIDFSSLPDSFVLKCTHDSGGVIVCKDKDTFDVEKARVKIDKCLSTDFFLLGREWPYKNVNHRIIVEKYIEDNSETGIKDYKVFCFNGVPKIIQLDYDRFVNHHRNLYDTDWKQLPIKYIYESDAEQHFEKPQHIDKVLLYAKILSKGIPFVRCDFYITKDSVFFGEMTFFPESGYGKFVPESWDIKLGSWLSLDMDRGL